jgi:dTDP-4-dehydrorhamnose 3,5-epimerase
MSSLNLAGGSELHLQIPALAQGVGRVIQSPESPDLIAGVKLTTFSVQSDDLGSRAVDSHPQRYRLESKTPGQGALQYGAVTGPQVIATVFNPPGAIKAFHYQKLQTNFWVPTAGSFQIALMDLRRGSPTFGVKNTVYIIGESSGWQILIPPGVAHGYKVIGNQPSTLVHLTNRPYGPKDKGRIAHDDRFISYDWDLPYGVAASAAHS